MFHDGATVRGTGKAIGRATTRGSAKSNRSVGTTPPAGRNPTRRQMPDMIHSALNKTHHPYAISPAKYRCRLISAKSLQLSNSAQYGRSATDESVIIGTLGAPRLRGPQRTLRGGGDHVTPVSGPARRRQDHCA
ncbi:hypothetical protein Pen02_46490 [Plantactinospora endophytica]|uniref:Uncharacterized protein n=1 Tax=Plantactinospora endophytica TaxID=673535 RepID=A0ABQ4E4U5_9ACTN|nr:hypothetical protein Pen02_46490 [Plantactinospora endophytica]